MGVQDIVNQKINVDLTPLNFQGWLSLLTKGLVVLKALVKPRVSLVHSLRPNDICLNPTGAINETQITRP